MHSRNCAAAIRQVFAATLIAVCSLASAKPYQVNDLVTLEQPDSRPLEDSRFGQTLAAFGPTLLVGAPHDEDRGAVYVFVRRSTVQWDMMAKILEPEGQTPNAFGTFVDLSGNTALIGDGRAVHVFVGSGATWTRQARLQPSGGGVQAAAIDGNRLILVQRGTGLAFAYRRDNGVWTRQATLTPDVNSAPFFNASMSGGLAVLGAPFISPFGDVFAGSAYVYRLKAVAGQRDVWIRETTLHPPATADHADPFGGSLDVSRNRVVVGLPGEHSGGGRAYVFARGTDGRWRETAVLHAFGPLETTVRCGYGANVAIHYDRIAALSPCTLSVDLSHRESGAETWIRRDRMVTGKTFGTLALSNCGAFVGVQGFSDGSGDAVYVLPSAICAPPITP